jgi:hypothetical protein
MRSTASGKRVGDLALLIICRRFVGETASGRLGDRTTRGLRPKESQDGRCRDNVAASHPEDRDGELAVLSEFVGLGAADAEDGGGGLDVGG